MQHLNLDGLKIAYTTVGSGAPLVLLHGGLSDYRDWRPQLEGLSSQFAMTAWDAPGCGRSDDPPDTWEMEQWATALKQLIDHLEIEKPHLLGLSWGSGLALEFYRLFPDVPASLMLAGAYAGWKGSLPAQEVERRLDLMQQEFDDPSDAFVPGFVSTLLTESAPKELVDEVTRYASEYHSAGSRTMITAFAKFDGRSILPTIEIPTLLIYGQRDARSPLDVANALHKQIPDSELHVIPDAGHLCNFEAPDQFNRAIRDFIDEM